MKAPRELRPCGTPSAYRRHLRRGEKACVACLKAHAQDVARFAHRPAAPPRELMPCGTPAAYRRHLTRGEVTCRACCDAHAAYIASYKRTRAA